MGRSKLKTLQETTLNTFNFITSQLQITSQFKYNGQKNIIYWKNGSEILLKDLYAYPSDPNFDSLGSLEITGAFIDECNQIVYKAWEVVKSRIRYRLTEFGLMPKLLGTCNPAKNWVYSEFYIRWKSGEMKPYRKFVAALPSDNPYNEPTYLPSLLQMEEASRQRLAFGNWEYDDDPATLIDQQSIVDYFNPHHIQRTIQDGKYMTIDVAREGVDKTVFRVWHGWMCIERHSMDISSIPQIISTARTLQAKHGIPVSNVIADEDGVGGGVVDGLNCNGFVNNSRPLQVLENGVMITPNFRNLKAQCSIKMAQLISDKKAGELATKEVADATGKEMEQVKLKDIDSDGKLEVMPKKKVKELLGRSPDDWDSIMMRYWFELQPVRSKNMNWAKAFG